MISLSALAEIPSQFVAGSYNLYGLRNPQELKNDLKALSFVDIWAFQEVEGTFTEKTRQKILTILPEGKWYLHFEKVNRTNDQNWEGQVIASKYPFENIEILELDHTGEKQRVAVIANFKSEDGKIFSFVNTDHEVDIFKLDFNDRKKQLKSLVDHFEQTHHATIITGDFNTTGGAQEITATEKIMLQANFSRIKSNNDPVTFEKFLIKKELDHFFTRGIQSTKRFKLNSRKGSDHYPIYIQVSTK